MPPFPELKDITPPVAPPYSSPEEVQVLIWQVFGVVAGLALLTAAWLWWRWRVRLAKVPPPPKSPLDQLRDRLLALQPQAAGLSSADLGHQTADAVRTYLQREHGLMARYRTTEELFGTHRGPRREGAPPPLPYLRPFADVFSLCDALKFAGSLAPESQRAALIDRALTALEEVRAGVAAAPNSPPPTPPLPPKTPLTPPPLPGAGSAAPAFAVLPAFTEPAKRAASPIAHRGVVTAGAGLPLAGLDSSTGRSGPRSDSFTHPQSDAFARGADIIPA